MWTGKKSSVIVVWSCKK